MGYYTDPEARAGAQAEAAAVEAREGIDALLLGTAEEGRYGYQEYRGISIGEHWLADNPTEADYAVQLLARLCDGQDVRPQIEAYVERARAYLTSLVDTDKIAAGYERQYRESVEDARIDAWQDARAA